MMFCAFSFKALQLVESYEGAENCAARNTLWGVWGFDMKLPFFNFYDLNHGSIII
jgi:hypothetical protein